MEQKYLRLNQLAKRWDITPCAAKTWVKTYGIPYLKGPRAILVDLASIHKFEEQNRRLHFQEGQGPYVA